MATRSHAPFAGPLRAANLVLWTIQMLLAALFLFAGGYKLVVPMAAMTREVPLPGPFLRFIGVAELAGGLGLILPGLFRTRLVLTPLAAAGLVIIMAGAVGVTMATAGAAQAAMPGIVGLLAGAVAAGRWRQRESGSASASPLALRAA